MTTSNETYEKGLQIRREVIGADYVDERSADDFSREYQKPLMHMAPVARVCHQMLRLGLGRGNG